MSTLEWMLLFAFISGVATGLAEYGAGLLPRIGRKRRSRYA